MLPTDDRFETKFTMESDKSGVIEETPFRILMLGDWSGDAAKRSLGERRPIEIDRDNFDEVISRLGVRIRLGDGQELSFSSLDDFHPDEIYKRVDIFAELRELRKRLKDPDTFNQAALGVRRLTASEEPDESATPTESAQKAPDDLLDAILASPSGGQPVPQSAVSRDLSSLISDLVRPHLVSVDEDEQKSMIRAVDAAIGDSMRSILHDPGFKELEAAWRGLFFQVRRTETASDLKIYLLDISKDELAGDLKREAGVDGSAIFRIAAEGVGEDRWSIICGNYGFKPDVDDTALLIRLSQVAASVNAPFISHMRPDVLGVHSLDEHPQASDWNMSDDSAAGKLWSALRGQPESKYLGMTIPRFLARLPYGSDSDFVETFGFEEFNGTPRHDDLVWSNACFIVALLFAQSFRAFEWDLSTRMFQDVEGMPAYIYQLDGETVFQPCAEVQLSQNAAEKLMEYGLMPLVSFKNTDRVRLLRFQSVTDPVSALKGRWS